MKQTTAQSVFRFRTQAKTREQRTGFNVDEQSLKTKTTSVVGFRKLTSKDFVSELHCWIPTMLWLERKHMDSGSNFHVCAGGCSLSLLFCITLLPCKKKGKCDSPI